MTEVFPGGLVIRDRRLPHWRLTGSTYYVTWRTYPGQVPLDPEERTLVADALKFFDRQRYKLLAFVVMDDHIHVILHPLEAHSLSKILHSWKSFTAHAICKRRGIKGPFWQDESYDRIIRGDSDLQEKLAYIFNNPKKRWPEIEDYPWLEWFEWE